MFYFGIRNSFSRTRSPTSRSLSLCASSANLHVSANSLKIFSKCCTTYLSLVSTMTILGSAYSLRTLALSPSRLPFIMLRHSSSLVPNAAMLDPHPLLSTPCLAVRDAPATEGCTACLPDHLHSVFGVALQIITPTHQPALRDWLNVTIVAKMTIFTLSAKESGRMDPSIILPTRGILAQREHINTVNRRSQQQMLFK